MIRKYGIVEV